MPALWVGLFLTQLSEIGLESSVLLRLSMSSQLLYSVWGGGDHPFMSVMGEKQIWMFSFKKIRNV